MFADDCILYTIGNNWNYVHAKLQAELNPLAYWFSVNGLKINIEKTKSMVVSTGTKLKNLGVILNLEMSGMPIQFVKQYNYLGIILDAEMSLIPLMKNIKKRVNNRMFQLRKIRKYINKQAAIMIYKQTILPIFDYAGFLLISVNAGDKHDLQVMQNDALRFCNGLKLLDMMPVA